MFTYETTPAAAVAFNMAAPTDGPVNQGRRRKRQLYADCVRIVVADLLFAVYRLRTGGLENIPTEGGAVVIHNHVSVVDWLFMFVACPRVPRFVMHYRDYDRPGLRWLFDAFGVIPIAPKKEDPELLARADRTIDEALAAGDLVVLCPEGTMTPDGELSPFREGAARIARRCNVPVVPVVLVGLWGSVFSRKNGAPLSGLPGAGRAQVSIVAGPPVAAERVSTAYLTEIISVLRGGRR
ncbi:MAG: 1-acyl-sn-glycerol-3-phosphate acyltransferase [Deltaproteobacteria bacterium]|nr:1-acyl-sn-glycerol-3-phosphate acyltransferase [Deltaproteobacteria bacterium]